MYKVVFTENAPKLKTKSLNDYNFNLDKISRAILVDGEYYEENVVQDKIMATYQSATYDSLEDVTVEDITQNNDIKTFESADEDIATIDQNGQVSRVSDGVARIIVSGKYLKKGVEVTVSRDMQESYTIFDRWADGSLSKDITDTIDNRIVGKTPSEAKPIFSTQNHSGQIYVRNIDCWAYGLDLTPISPWNSTGGNTRAGTLISPKHIIFATHYQIAVGATVRFIKQDNTVVDRVMTAKQSIEGTDITIGVLDSDVPEGISFAKIMPVDWDNYAPNIIERLPVLALDQQEQALINDINYYSGGNMLYFISPSDAQRVLFYEDKIGGDSGNPACFIINNELILLTCWWYGGAGSGSNISYYKTEINSVMTSLGGGYQLTEIDLSGFSNFA